MRLNATYTDIGETGEIRSDPFSVKSENVEPLIAGAQILLTMMIVFLFSKELQDGLIRSFAPDLTGTHILMPLIEWLQNLMKAKA